MPPGRPHCTLGRAVAEPVVGARGDGAVGLDKDRGRDAVNRQCRVPSCRLPGERVFLHGIKQHTIEVLIVCPDIVCQQVVSFNPNPTGNRVEYVLTIPHKVSIAAGICVARVLALERAVRIALVAEAHDLHPASTSTHPSHQPKNEGKFTCGPETKWSSCQSCLTAYEVQLLAAAVTMV